MGITISKKKHGQLYFFQRSPNRITKQNRLYPVRMKPMSGTGYDLTSSDRLGSFMNKMISAFMFIVQDSEKKVAAIPRQRFLRRSSRK